MHDSVGKAFRGTSVQYVEGVHYCWDITSTAVVNHQDVVGYSVLYGDITSTVFTTVGDIFSTVGVFKLLSPYLCKFCKVKCKILQCSMKN